MGPSNTPTWASLVAQAVKNLPAMQETQVQSLHWEDPLEKGMATHSSIIPWKILWQKEPGKLSPWGPKESDTTESELTHTNVNGMATKPHSILFQEKIRPWFF